MDAQTAVDHINQQWAYVLIFGLGIIGVIVARSQDILGIIDRLRDWRLQDINTLKQLAENEGLSEPLRNALLERAESRIFSKYFGIITDCRMRNALIELNKQHPVEASWYHLRHASAYMNVSDGHLEINIPKSVTFFSWVGKIYGTIVTLFALTILLLDQFSSGITWQIGVVVVFMIICALIGYMPSIPYSSAKKIEKLLESERAKSAEKDNLTTA